MNKISYSIEPTKENGFLTISAISESGRKIYLHSKVSPSKEFSFIQNMSKSSKIDTVISIGCGLGYFLFPIVQSNSIKNIIIIDILEKLDANIQKYSVINKYIDKIETTFILGKDISEIDSLFNKAFSVASTNNILIIEHAASVRAFPDYYSKAKEIVEKNIRKQAGNLITKKAFSSLYVRNCIKMLPLLPSFVPFNSLKNRFIDYSCIIVSSAPSIDTYIELIRQHANRFFIIAIDSAYPILKSNGIVPDFILTIDPQPWTEEHLLEIDPNIPVITTLSAYNHSAKSTVSLISLNTHPFCQIMDQAVPGIGSIDSTSGTVAGDALCAASEMGFSKILITGVDFSFPKEIIYSKDSKYNQRYTSIFNNRFVTTETLHISYIRKSPRRTIEEKVRTRQSFLQFRDSFEKNILQKNMTTVYVLKDKGLSIKGAVELDNITAIFSLLSEISVINNKKSIVSTIIKETKKLSSRFAIFDIKKLFLTKNLFKAALTESMPAEDVRMKLSKYKKLINSLLEEKI